MNRTGPAFPQPLIFNLNQPQTVRGMTILNLGCGTKASSHSTVINYDWSVYLRIRKNPVLRMLAPVLLRGVRRERFRNLPENVVCHNLAKGIPHQDNSVDAVYHSHLLEHLDRPVGLQFIKEVYRVLKPGGIHRIVIPDLEVLCRAYLDHLDLCRRDGSQIIHHEERIADIIEQCVRREGVGATEQSPFRRKLDNLILGDARQRGETHQWMYDSVNLATALTAMGFRSPVAMTFDASGIPDWKQIGLDINPDGTCYKANSLYMEAMK